MCMLRFLINFMKTWELLIITFPLYYRNAAADLVDQNLLFVGSERGKLVEFRNIIQKVR